MEAVQGEESQGVKGELGIAIAVVDDSGGPAMSASKQINTRGPWLIGYAQTARLYRTGISVRRHSPWEIKGSCIRRQAQVGIDS